MHSDPTVATSMRPPLPTGAAEPVSELERLRAMCPRQALVIEKLTEDVAMFRRAAVARAARSPARRRAAPLPDGSAMEPLEEHLPLDIHAPAAARSIVKRAVRGHVAPSVLEIAELVISELLSNSVRHSAVPLGKAVVIVRVQLDETTCRLEVEDPGRAGVVAPRAPDPLGGGVGLHLVQSLSERWGVERVAKGGTRVWA